MFSLGRCLFRSLAYFLFDLPFLLTCKSYLYILNTIPYQIHESIISPQFCGLCVYFLHGNILKRSIFNFDEFQLTHFLKFYHFCFCCHIKENIKDLLLYFFLRIFKVSRSIFKFTINF